MDPSRETLLCPACGAELANELSHEGLCPSCLIELALESPSLMQEALVESAPTAEHPTAAGRFDGIPAGHAASPRSTGGITAEPVPPGRPGEDETFAYSRPGYQPGQVLGKRFRVRTLLGRGGMGEVWRATDLKLRVDVALKALRVELLDSQASLETLRQEVRAAREVVSPNVCRVFDLVELDGQELVSMEYIDGVTLLDILKLRAPLDLTEAREIAAQFLAGLEAIHSVHLVHRDVKPENLMMTRSGRVVLMDFGIAKGLQEGATGTIAGTPAYMSPEQAAGDELDARADVFAAGVVLAEMVAPGGLKTPAARQQIWRRIHRQPPEVPESPWAAVVRQSVAPDRGHRYSTAAALSRALEEVTLRAAGDEDLQPYPGLASFTEEDAEYFFGRELEIEEMWKKLRRPLLLALIGPSGAGKSSFLRAGLLPVMPTGWRACLLSPGNQPFRALARALVDELAGDTEALKLLTSPDDVDALLEAVRRWRATHESTLLILDQFEELFTQNPPEKQERFAELLSRIALDADVHVLLAMRDDFLFHCASQESLAPIYSELTPLKSLSGAALRRALVQPALKCGYRFEDDRLVDEMIEQVGDERGALPLLAFAAARLWTLRDREHGVLTREAYEHIGGVAGALAQHAEHTLERIGKHQIPTVREIFRNLVTSQGTRVAHSRAELLSVFETAAGSNEVGSSALRWTGHPRPESPDRDRSSDRSQPGTDSPASRPEPVGERPIAGYRAADDSGAADVLDELVEARLLTAYEEPAPDDVVEPQQRIEIIHESLLSNWPRLVRWRTQDADSAQLRDQLRQAAQMWAERGHPEDLLWTGTSYKEFELWRERYEGGLSDSEETFATAMKTKAERRKRQRRLGLSAAFVFMAVVVAVVWTSRQRAVVAEAAARDEARRAAANELLALGRVEEDRYRTATVAYAAKSIELADTPESRRLALEALWQGPVALIISTPPIRGEMNPGLIVSPDGSRMAAAMPETGEVFVLSREGELVSSLELPPDEYPWKTHFSLDGELLVVCRMRGPEVRVYSMPEGDLIRSFQPGPVNPEGKQNYPDVRIRGQRMFVHTWFEGVRQFEVWPLGNGRQQVISTFRDDTTDSAGRIDEDYRWDVDPTGSWIISAPQDYGDGQTIYRRPVARFDEWSRVEAIGKYEDEITDLMLSTSGERLYLHDKSGRFSVFELDGSSAVLMRKEQLPASDFSPAFDSEASLLAWPTTDRSARLFDLDAPPGGRAFRLGRFDEDRTLSPTFDPGGEWLATRHDGSISLWQLTGSWSRVFDAPNLWSDLVFSQDSRRLVSCHWDGARVWALTPEVAEGPEIDHEGCFNLALHPTRNELLVGVGFETPTIVSLADGTATPLPGPMISSVFGPMTFDSVGERAVLARAEENQPLRIWTLDNGDFYDLPIQDGPSGHGHTARDLRFDHDGHLYSAGQGGIRKWDLEAGTNSEFLASDLARIDMSPDKRQLLVATGERSGWTLERAELFLIDLATGKRTEVSTHGDSVQVAAIGPHGKVIVTGDALGTVRVGSISGGQPHFLLGHQGHIKAVAVSPDGRWVFSATSNEIRQWPLPDLSQTPVHTLPTGEFLDLLHATTNLRVVEDLETSGGWRLEPIPLPAWKEELR